MLKNKLGIFLNSKNKKTYFFAFPLLSLIVILFFQNCGKKFQVVDLASTGSVVAESDPSILKGKFLEVHADPEAHTSQKVSFYVIKSDNGGLFLLDKNNYPHGAFDAIKRNSSVTVHLSNESIGTVLLSKNQMMKVNSTLGALKPEQVLSSEPPVLIKIKGDLIYQNLPVMSSLTAEVQLQNKQQSINTKTAASGEADLNVAVVTFSFRNIGSADLGFAAFSTDAAVQQLNKNSYNKIRLHFDKDSDAYIIDNYNLGAAGNYDGCEHWITYSEQANRYAAAQGATKNKSYHRVVTILPTGIVANAKDCNWAGITDGGVYNNLDSIPHIVSKGAVVHTIAHELGHTLDLGHSGAQNMNDPYADTYDVMGRGDFFNGAKLLDLKLFKLHSGLEFAPEGDNGVEIYSKDKDPGRSPNKPYLYVMGNYVISYAPSYGGVAIHSYTGEGHSGNPSSKKITILTEPKQEWTSEDKKYRVIFKSLDLVNDKAEIGFNNSDTGSGVVIGGCRITKFAPSFSLSPDVLRSDIKQELNGKITISYVPDSDFGFIGDCAKEKVGMQIESADGAFNLPNGIFTFEADLKSSDRSYKYIKIPYHLNGYQTSQATIRIRYFHYNQNENHRYEISNTLQTLGFNTVGCGNRTNCNDSFNKCDASPSVTHLFDKEIYLPNDTANGYLIVANNNDPSCGDQLFQLEVMAYRSGINIGNFISFGDTLPNILIANKSIVKSISMKGGSAVYLPVTIFNKSPISDSDFYFVANLKIPRKIYFSSSLINLNGQRREHWGSSNIAEHPYHPVALSDENIFGDSGSGKAVSTTTTTTTPTPTTLAPTSTTLVPTPTTRPQAPKCGGVTVDGSGLNPGVARVGSACGSGSNFIANSLGFDSASAKWMWRCGNNSNQTNCYTDLHQAVCNSTYTGNLVNGQTGGCYSGYARKYSNSTNGTTSVENWFCGDNLQVTDRHFRESVMCSRSSTTITITTTTTTTKPQSATPASCGVTSGNRTNSLFATWVQGQIKTSDLCGDDSELVNNPYSLYPTVSVDKMIHLNIGPWDWKCKNKTSGQTIICRAQRTDVKPCSYYRNNSYSKLGEYRSLMGCTSSSQQYCDDDTVKWHLENKGINDGFCAADLRANPTY